MQISKKIIFISVAIVALLLTVSGCSTKKNTRASRFYHALTTRYNVYFNGNEAYRAGCKTQEENNKDNYMEVIPFYPIGNKKTAELASGNFERAIEKSKKAVTLHSIKKKPKRKPGKKYSQKYKQWSQRKEFNPFLHNAWMLMGKAQMHKGDFPEAAATFSYITRLYSDRPEIRTRAKIYLAQCYTLLEWFYDAEDVLLKLNNDSLPQNLISNYETAQGVYLLGTKRYQDALPYLEKAAKHEKNKYRKARQYFLLGQIYQLLGDTQQSYNSYGKVIKLSPPYELSLNARIRQTEGLRNKDTKGIVKKLQKMTRSDKNKDYLDQIYYAIGNVYLADADTLSAIHAYKEGVTKSTRGGVEKGILQLTLGNLCWNLGRYKEAQEAYADAIGLLDQTHADYKEITRRTTVLDELVPYASTIELQDSLQHLASLDSASLKIVIDTLIARVERQEEIERQAQKDNQYQQLRDEVMAENESNTLRPTTPTTPQIGNSDGSWYFYNTQTVAQGKADFERIWGKRKLEDNWRRRNKTVVALDAFDNDQTEEEETVEDGVTGDRDGSDKTEKQNLDVQPEDTVTIDNKNPLFYLKQIPFTPEAKAESDSLLSDALFHMGVILKDKLEDFKRAEPIFDRLKNNFSMYANLDAVYYHSFLMYGRMKRLADAELNKQKLISNFPASKYAQLLSDPDYVKLAMHGRHLEDSLYADTYLAYQGGLNDKVTSNNVISKTKFPTGKHRSKFMFLNAVSALQHGKQAVFLSELKELVQNYPEAEISDLAAHILKGVKDGRLLATGSVSFGSMWARRSADLALDSLHQLKDSMPTFNEEHITPYMFVLAYEEGKVDENQLLYEIARYNFSSFVVKEFDIKFEHLNGIGRMIITSFANYDEALYYQRRLYTDPRLSKRLSGMRSLVISENNYQLLNQYYSFDDYEDFYKRKFSLPDLDGELLQINGGTLDEPMNNLPPEEEIEETEEEELEEIEENNSIIIF